MKKRRIVTTGTIKREKMASRQSFAAMCVKNLRKKATPYEKKFYTLIRKKHPSVIFQKAFVREGKTYIVDFYLPFKGIIIELDGSQHYKDDYRKRDADRDSNLESWGFKVVRIKNTEINYVDIDLLLKN